MSRAGKNAVFTRVFAPIAPRHQVRHGLAPQLLQLCGDRRRRSTRRAHRSARASSFSDLRLEDAVFNRTWNTWNQTSGMGRWLRALGVGAAIAATLPGCLAHARGEVVYDYPVTYVDDAPVRIETYPSTYYHGRPAYLVDGRWYYRSGPRWVYFREEPRELYTYRQRYVASPRYRDDHRGDRYSDVVEKRRAERYRDERRAQNRAEERRAEQRRAAQRAESRRLEERRAIERRRAEERRRDERRAAEARADQRRAEDRRAEQRRSERKGRVADRHPNDNRRRDRDRDDRDRRYRND